MARGAGGALARLPLNRPDTETNAKHPRKGARIERTAEDKEMLKPERALITWLMAILPAFPALAWMATTLTA